MTPPTRWLLGPTCLLLTSCIMFRWGHLEEPEGWPAPPPPESRLRLCIEWEGAGIGWMDPWLAYRTTQMQLQQSNLFREVRLDPARADLRLRYRVHQSPTRVLTTALLIPFSVFSGSMAPLAVFGETSLSASYSLREGGATDRWKQPIELPAIREEFGICTSLAFVVAFPFHSADGASARLLRDMNQTVVRRLVERGVLRHDP